jgi:hypothetical protein
VAKSESVVDNCQIAGSVKPACQALAKMVVPQVRTLMLYQVFLATQSMLAP